MSQVKVIPLLCFSFLQLAIDDLYGAQNMNNVSWNWYEGGWKGRTRETRRNLFNRLAAEW